MDSGGDSSFLDDSSSDTGPALSATTPMSTVSPGSSNPNEGKIKNTTIGGGSAEGPVTSPLNLHEYRDSWLDIDHFPESYLEFEDSVAEDKHQKIGNIEDESGSNNAKGGQAEDGSQEIEHNGNGAGDRPGNEDEVEYGGDDVIVDPVIDGIEMDNRDGPQIKDGHSLGVGGNGEGWCHPRASFALELTLQFQESRTYPTPKHCTPLIAGPAGVGVDLAAADLRL